MTDKAREILIGAVRVLPHFDETERSQAAGVNLLAEIATLAEGVRLAVDRRRSDNVRIGWEGLWLDITAVGGDIEITNLRYETEPTTLELEYDGHERALVGKQNREPAIEVLAQALANELPMLFVKPPS